MKVIFTVKVKGKNVPEFKSGMGKGVLERVIISYKDEDIKKISGPRLLLKLIEEETKIVNDCVESSFKIIPSRKSKKKLNGKGKKHKVVKRA
jgi:hypothetical protein